MEISIHNREQPKRWLKEVPIWWKQRIYSGKWLRKIANRNDRATAFCKSNRIRNAILETTTRKMRTTTQTTTTKIHSSYKLHCKINLLTLYSKRHKITKTVRFVEVCDILGVSDRAAAITASSASPNKSSKVIDHSKIRRKNAKTRQELTKLIQTHTAVSYTCLDCTFTIESI